MVGLPGSPPRVFKGLQPGPDLAQVRGLETAKRGLEVAAAGGHSLLLVGRMGAGKTILARRLPSLLPFLDVEEAAEVAALYLRAGLPPPIEGRRPFRRPDPRIRIAELVGTSTRPGEASLAHRGVLVLDDLGGH